MVQTRFMFIVLFVRAAVGIDCFAKILRWEPLRYSHPTFFPLSLGEPAPQMAGQGVRVCPLGCFLAGEGRPVEPHPLLVFFERSCGGNRFAIPTLPGYLIKAMRHFYHKNIY